MPLIGMATSWIPLPIALCRYCLAAIVIFLVGVKLLRENENLLTQACETMILSYGLVYLLAIGTSLDALAVGVGLGLLDFSKIMTFAMIAIVTFLAAVLGMVSGQGLHRIASKASGPIAGLVLIILALQIFFNHTPCSFFPSREIFGLPGITTEGENPWLGQRSNLVTRGEELARASGCTACHERRAPGIPHPRAVGTFIPPWIPGMKRSLTQSENDIQAFILGSGNLSLSFKTTRTMPTFEGNFSTADLSALSALVTELNGWNPKIPENALRGLIVAWDSGCLGCHSAGGLCLISNPGAPGNVIPAWDSPLSMARAPNADSIRNWIVNGRKESAPETKGMIAMPAFANRVTPTDSQGIVDYITWVQSSEIRNLTSGQEDGIPQKR